MVVKGLEGLLAEPRVKCSNPAEYFEKLVAKFQCKHGNCQIMDMGIWVGKFTCRNENATLYLRM
jgi:hypothetical protein